MVSAAPLDLLEIEVEDRHLELVGDLAVLLLAEEHRDELVSDENLGGIGLLWSRAHLEIWGAENLPQIILQAGNFFRFHGGSPLCGCRELEAAEIVDPGLFHLERRLRASGRADDLRRYTGDGHVRWNIGQYDAACGNA